MEQRTFQLFNEWCIVHYPEKPSGFGVLIIGDTQHFVDEKSSFWLQHYGRNQMLNELLDAGYTVFTSNLYGKHWGSENAAELIELLYGYLMKTEILNRKIHIITEGMGSLLLPKLNQKLLNNIRSICIVSPCVSLRDYAEQEKHQRLFFKRWLQEVSLAHQQSVESTMGAIRTISENNWSVGDNPLFIAHIVERGKYEGQISHVKRIFERRTSNGFVTEFHYIMPEKRILLMRKMIYFMRKFEKVL